jgi:hypothetical protein
MNSIPRTSGILLLASLAATVAYAQVTLELETTTYVPAVESVATDTENIVAGSASVSTAYGGGTATSTFGLMHLISASSATYNIGHGDTLSTQGYSRAKWEDSILVTAAAPELAGTGGRLHVQFTVSGTLNVPHPVASTFVGAQPVSAGWQISVNRAHQFGDENSVNGGRSIYIDAGPTSLLNGSPDFQTYDLYIPFTFGESFNFRVTGSAQSFAQPRGMELGASLGSSSDITVTWLGLVGVTDEADNPLSGITVASTGDWLTTSAIPEPSTYAALAGLAALGLAAWRRKRSQLRA